MKPFCSNDRCPCNDFHVPNDQVSISFTLVDSSNGQGTDITRTRAWLHHAPTGVGRNFCDACENVIKFVFGQSDGDDFNRGITAESEVSPSTSKIHLV